MRFFAQLVCGVAASLFLAALLPGRLAAQSPVVLQTFTNTLPSAIIQGTDGALYGTLYVSSDRGEVFRAAVDGSSFEIIYSTPDAQLTGLIQGSDGVLYVSALTTAGGLVFRLGTDGSGYTPIYAVTFPDPAGTRESSFIGVIQGSDGVLYGATSSGLNDLMGFVTYAGTLFRVNKDGSGAQVLSTQVGATGTPFQLANGALCGYSDGSEPPLTGGFTYEINTDGSGFTELYAGQGVVPELLGADGVIYGVQDGSNIVRINADGSGYSVLMAFSPSVPGNPGTVTARLYLQGADGALYGTVFHYDASYDQITNLFKLATDGSGYSVLQTFTQNNDGTGWGPETFIQGSGGTLYGLGLNSNSTGGTLFSLGVDSPFFTINPVPVTIANGRSSVFNAAATGVPAPAYQWFLNGNPVPGATDPILIVSGATAANAGDYTCVATNSAGTTSSTSAALTVDPAGAAGYLGNISARGDVGAISGETGPGILFGGFAVSGAKQVLIRGLGPGMAFNFPAILSPADVVANPVLDLFDESLAEIASNDGWGTSGLTNAAMLSVGAYALQAGSLDSVLETALAPGGYNVWVSTAGTGPATGLGAVEIYDADAGPSASRIVNLSARDFAGTGSHILIGGLVVGGTDCETLLIRGIGPGLNDTFGLQGYLAQPLLQILDSAGKVIFSNAGWNGDATIAAVSAEVGAYPLNPVHQDSALLISLPPGNYSAFVSGLGGGTGQAAVEFYEVP